MIKVSTRGRVPVEIMDAQGMRAVGDRLVELIRLRTAQGRAATGRRFKPYSDAYREAGGADTLLPDLRRTGAMLGAVQITEVTGRRVVVGVPGIPYAGRVNKKRRFMGVAPDELAELAGVAAGEAARILEGGQP